MRVRKTDETKLAEVTGRLRDLHMNTMAEELIRLDESGELYSEPAIDILDQLTSLQEISSDNSATERYKKAARLYWPMADLLYSFREAEEKGKYVKFLNKVANTNLIIIDDFLLTTAEQRDVEYLYRLVNSKTRKNKPRSFIICSQLMPAEMYTRLSTVSPSLADGIVNRLFAKSYSFKIEGSSMREIDIPSELQRQKSSQ